MNRVADTARRPAQRRTPRAPLSSDACPTCGTQMKPKTGPLSLPVNGERVKVPGIPHLSCPACGEKLLSWEQDGMLTAGAHKAYREKYDLLSPAQIQALRARLDLTQAELARLLRLGANTISRWEAGRCVQSAAMDVLLRLVADKPDTIDWLKKRAA